MKLPIIIQEYNLKAMRGKKLKRFSGFVAGIDRHISAEANTKIELVAILTKKCKSLEVMMLKDAQKAWLKDAENVDVWQITLK